MRKIFAAALAALTLGLAGCGGGGGSTASPAAVVATPAPVVVATTSPAQLTVPSPSYTSPDALAAFNYLNSIRTAAGLGLLAQNTKLDTAALAHMTWQVANKILYSHYETAGTPGFTGVDPAARFTAAGYKFNTMLAGGGEVVGGAASALEAVDGLMGAIYHRGGMLGGFHEAGFGVVKTGVLYSLTSDLGNAEGVLPQSNVQTIAIWPADGATGVARIHSNEDPYPVPELGAWCSPTCPGYPVSVHVDDLTAALTSFVITDSTGAAVPAKQIQQDTGNRMFALVPLAKLAANSTYTVQFVGKVNGKPASKTWSFTTGAK